MSGDNRKKSDESERKDQADFPTLSQIGSVEEIGTQIGLYKLLSVLGEGGFGIVYLAEQKEPVRRQVALKVIKPGMDSKQVIGRFEQERQALAMLDHPNIAHIYDGGTTEAGRPYFVMEYVKGYPITEYCDKKELNIETRLELFEQVCEAVQHAHQKGIIHRDLKPSNILVKIQDGKPVPMIIDFGIAKATQSLTERSFVTELHEPIGTVEYMSPEQAEMTIHGIDTRSDIYSLGIVLYELLTGMLPFTREELEKAGRAEIHRIIRETDPPRPSTRLSNLGEEAKKIAEKRHTEVAALARRLHKELEWIPLKAMRKEPDRRYKTASELADDIRNYLNGDALIAGPESAAYRARKFTRKHKGSIASIASIILILVVALIVVEAARRKAVEALQQRDQAKEETGIAKADAKLAEKIAEEQRRLARKRLEQTRRASYRRKIQLADEQFRKRKYVNARVLLNSCPTNRRGWEWYFLSRVCREWYMPLDGHVGFVRAVSFSPDSKKIVSCDEDTIKVWDADTGSLIAALESTTQLRRSVCFDPNGKLLAASSKNEIGLWDLSGASPVVTLTRDSAPITAITFGSDGKSIASADETGTITIWDIQSRTVVRSITDHNDTVSSLVFDQNEERLVSCCFGKGPSGVTLTAIKIWNTANGSLVTTVVLGGDERDASVGKVALSPDGKYAICCDSRRKNLWKWDLTTFQRTLEFEARSDDNTFGAVFIEGILNLACSNGCEKVVTGSRDGHITLWDGVTGREIASAGEHTAWISLVAVSPNGEKIVSSSERALSVWTPKAESVTFDVQVRQSKSWPLESGHSIDHFECGLKDTADTWTTTPNNVKLELLEGKTDIHWQNQHLMNNLTQASILGFSPDHRYAVTMSYESLRNRPGDKKIDIWEISDRAKKGSFFLGARNISSFALRKDGERIATATYDLNSSIAPFKLAVWDVETGDNIWTILRQMSIGGVYFSEDGMRLVSVSEDRAVDVWDTASGERLLTINPEAKSNGFAIDMGSNEIIAEAIAFDVMTGIKEGIPSQDSAVQGYEHVSRAREIITLLNPEDPYSWYDLAAYELEKGYRVHLGRIIADFSKAIELEPADPNFWYKRGVAYHMAGDPNRASLDFDTVLYMYPEDHNYWYEAGLALERQRKNEIAVMAMDRAIRIEPKMVAYLCERGKLYLGVKQYDSAIADFSRAVQLEPWNHQHLISRAEANIGKGEYSSAIADCNAAIQLNPKDPNCLIKRGMVYLENGQQELAHMDFKAAYQLGDDTYRLLNRKASDYCRMKQYDQAIAIYNMIITTDPNQIDILWSRAEAYVQTQDYDLAIADFTRLILDPEDPYYLPYYLRERAKIYNQMTKYDLAIADYAAAIEMEPDNHQWINDLAWIYATHPLAEIRNSEKAVELATKACKLTKWNDFEYLDTLAAAYAETGDFESAVKWQEKAIELLPVGARYTSEFKERLKLYESGKPYHENQ